MLDTAALLGFQGHLWIYLEAIQLFGSGVGGTYAVHTGDQTLL